MHSKILITVRCCAIATFFSVYSIAAFGQSPCKYVKETTNEWTKATVKTAQMTIGNGFAGREVILQITEGKFCLGLNLTYNTDFPDVVFKKGDKVSFKLANDDVIEVTATKDVAPVVIRILDVPIRLWCVNQEVPKKVFEELAASPIIAIKFKLNGNEYPLPEIKDRQTRKIMETAACMLSEK